jgi:hypothetical protein
MVVRPVPEVAPGPGAPRVHVTVAPGSAPGVELRQLLGWEVIDYNIQAPSGSANGAMPAAAGDSGAKTVAVGRRVCEPPCDRAVDGRRGEEYYFAGPGVTESSHFTLAGESGDVSFTVRPGRSSVARAGVVLAALGGITAAVGTTVTLLFAAGGDYSGGSSPTGGTLGPPIAMGVGAAVLGAGIALVLMGKTTYTRTRVPTTVALSW